MEEKGILLCAVGSDKYYTLCNTIIRDIREVMPNVSICVYTDCEKSISNANIYLKGEHNPNLVFLSKINACQKSPFNKTIFIDVDSRVLRTIDHLFKILDYHDLGLTFATGRKTLKSDDWDPHHAGLTLSSSILLFKNKNRISNLFNRWEKEYTSQRRFPGHGDQYYLKYLLYKDTNIRYFTLPDEYQFNTDHPTFVAGNIKILTSLISDIDIKGKFSRSRLDNIFNPSDIFERVIYVKLLGGPIFKKRSYFLPYRLVVKCINKTGESFILRSFKRFIKRIRRK